MTNSLQYLLDSNACIHYITGRSVPLRDKIIATPINSIFVCSVVKAEMFYGSMKSQNPAKSLAEQQLFLNQFKSLPFDDDCALIFGEIRAELAKKGTPIGAYDLQIAAIALANDLILITHNIGEFGRIGKLKIEDWETP
jgi:tRNA(fMet)-specific endonuclease VapC